MINEYEFLIYWLLGYTTSPKNPVETKIFMEIRGAIQEFRIHREEWRAPDKTDLEEIKPAMGKK